MSPENTSNNDDDKTVDLDLKALDVDSISESISKRVVSEKDLPIFK